MRRIVLLAALPAALLALAPASAIAAEPDSFFGNCHITGTSTTPPSAQQADGYTFRGEGTCNSILNGEQVMGAPVTNTVKAAV